MTAKTTPPKRILLHRAGLDNAGRYRDAGTELTIGDEVGEKGENLITETRAQELLDSAGAELASAEG